MIIAVAAFTPARAQWAEPIRISNGLGLLGPRIITVDKMIHVVASGGAGGACYFRSSDNGESWSEPVISPESCYGGSETPDISTLDGLLHFIRKGQLPNDARFQIFHFSNNDSGTTWGYT